MAEDQFIGLAHPEGHGLTDLTGDRVGGRPVPQDRAVPDRPVRTEFRFQRNDFDLADRGRSVADVAATQQMAVRRVAGNLEHRERAAVGELPTEPPVVVHGTEVAWTAAVIADTAAREIESLVADRDCPGRLTRLLVVALRPCLGLDLFTEVP